MICNFGGWPQNHFTTSEAFWTNMFHCFGLALQLSHEICWRSYSIALARCLSSFFFGTCNIYEIVAYDWLYSQYWGQVKMVNMASKFLTNIGDWCLFLVCYLGLFGRFSQISIEWRNTNHIGIGVWRKTTCSELHFPAIYTFQNQKFLPQSQRWWGIWQLLNHGILILQIPYSYCHSPGKTRRPN